MKSQDKFLDRFTVCLEKGMLSRLDEIASERGYPSRSQALADFLRRAIVKKDWKGGRECVGTISLYYDSADSRPARAVEMLFARYAVNVAAVQTVMLKNGAIMTSASVIGKPAVMERLADALRAVKGVTYGAFSIVAPI